MQSAKQLLTMVLVLLMSSATLFAQQALSNWSNVENLIPGTKIVVRTKNGREFVGTKRQSTDDTLFMEAKFPVQFYYPLLGLAIGLGVGVAIGARADHPGTDDPNLGKMLGGGLGGGIGLIAGEGISRKPKTKRVYLAP